MSSGHASHKGTSIKPNTNASDRQDTASDLSVNPEEMLPEGGDALRVDEAPANPEATQRPEATT